MDAPQLGEIRMYAGLFAPPGWAICDGRLISIVQNDALFSLLGTTYGGDGQTTFALPDLRSRVPVHRGQAPGMDNYYLGQPGGQEIVALTTAQIPSHAHPSHGSSSAGTSSTPTGNFWATCAAAKQYASAAASNGPMDVGSMGYAGGYSPHNNMVPYVAINFIIALVGRVPAP